MLPVVFRIPEWIPLLGDQAVTSFGVMLLAAFLAAGFIFTRRLRRVAPRAAGWDLVVTAAVAGLVGAKATHLAVHAALGLPSGGLGRGGLDWFGGLAVGAVAVLWHARRLGLESGPIAGLAAAPLALGLAVGRVGSFLVGADYGLPTSLPWGVRFPAGAPPTTPTNLREVFGVDVPAGAVTGDFAWVHPTQLYEAALSLAIFWLLERRAARAGGPAVAGWRLFGLYLILAGAARGVVELVRAKQDQLWGPITVDLLFALAVVAVGFLLWNRYARNFELSEIA